MHRALPLLALSGARVLSPLHLAGRSGKLAPVYSGGVLPTLEALHLPQRGPTTRAGKLMARASSEAEDGRVATVTAACDLLVQVHAPQVGSAFDGGNADPSAFKFNVDLRAPTMNTVACANADPVNAVGNLHASQ